MVQPGPELQRFFGACGTSIAAAIAARLATLSDAVFPLAEAAPQFLQSSIAQRRTEVRGLVITEHHANLDLIHKPFSCAGSCTLI